MVLQVHYAAVDKIPESGDRSGVVLTYTDRYENDDDDDDDDDDADLH